MADDLPFYKAFLLRYPCRVQPCVAVVMVHHHTKAPTYPPWARPPKAIDGPRGKSQRASDWFGMPICFAHHNQLHDPVRGHFAGWTGEQLVAWQDEQVAAMHSLYEQECKRNPAANDWTTVVYPVTPRAARKRGKVKSRMAEAIDEFQRLAPNAFADLDGTLAVLEPPEGSNIATANAERAATVQWLRDRISGRQVPAEVHQELSIIADELAAITEPLSLHRG